MRALLRVLTSVVMAGLLLLAVPAASAQKPKPMPAQPPPAAPMAQQPVHQQVVVVEPVRVFDPFFAYPYPYAYPPDYMAANFGYVKIKTDRKDASVFVDGGYADKVEKAKKFTSDPVTTRSSCATQTAVRCTRNRWRSSSAKPPTSMLAKTVMNGHT